MQLILLSVSWSRRSRKSYWNFFGFDWMCSTSFMQWSLDFVTLRAWILPFSDLLFKTSVRQFSWRVSLILERWEISSVLDHISFSRSKFRLYWSAFPAMLLILLKFLLVYLRGTVVQLLSFMHCFTTFFIFFFFPWECLIMQYIVLCIKVVRHLILAGHEVHVASFAPQFVFTSAMLSPGLFIRKVSLVEAHAWLLVIAAKLSCSSGLFVSFQILVSISFQ